MASAEAHWELQMLDLEWRVTESSRLALNQALAAMPPNSELADGVRAQMGILHQQRNSINVRSRDFKRKMGENG